jgi:Cu+-exporting ATPase
MTCAACAVRVQKKLSKLDGVTASVNYATGTARVTAPAGVPVGMLTGAVEAAGYSARPAELLTGADEDADSEARRHASYLWHRLIVALVFFVPLTDLSLTLSMIPSGASPAGPGSSSGAPRRWRSGRPGRSTRPH